MITKLAVLFFAGACLAFPVDEELRLTNGEDTPSQDIASPQAILPPQAIPPPQSIVPSQAIPRPEALPPQAILPPSPEGFQPEGELQDGPVPPQGTAGGKPDNSDLKTDSTYWYHRSYPYIYRRHHYYRPRSYYYYWNPYYWW